MCLVYGCIQCYVMILGVFITVDRLHVSMVLNLASRSRKKSRKSYISRHVRTSGGSYRVLGLIPGYGRIIRAYVGQFTYPLPRCCDCFMTVST